MEQLSFFDTTDAKQTEFDLNNGLTVLFKEEEKKAILFCAKILVKEVKLNDKAALKVFLVEAMELGANQTYLANAFGISRQTLHNYRETKRHFGLEGLIHNYGSRKRSAKTARTENVEKLQKGNTNELLRQARKKEKETTNSDQLTFDFFVEQEPAILEQGADLYQENHDWEATRYAGTAVYQPVLIKVWSWLRLIGDSFGKDVRIFMVFLLMSASNTRSLEQIKNLRNSEAARSLGLSKFPHKKLARQWFYAAASERKSDLLLKNYQKFQIRSGLVNTWIFFTDGHVLPYTGKENMRYAFDTKRREPRPGRTNMVTCDLDGKIVDFDIQEGTGDLRQHILNLAKKWKDEASVEAIHVFDREGNGKEFFYELFSKNISFVTWEKNIDKQKLDAKKDSSFNQHFSKNGKTYRVFEDKKEFEFTPDPPPEEEKMPIRFSLRRIYIWNCSSNRRTCGLSFSDSDKLSTIDCAKAILSRWGASENTFKHMLDRHPLHYTPGFKKVESEHQEFPNPELKTKKKLVSKLKKIVDKLRIELSKVKDVVNKDGKRRRNNKFSGLSEKIETKENERQLLKSEIKTLPERVDAAKLEDYRSFKKIDNEGKYLFDFVTSSVWNARKWIVNVLKPYYNNDDEVVDLFYAISSCHGWVKVTDQQVCFRLEPLQQGKRRLAQEFLCKTLTALRAEVSSGKIMVFEVGDNPIAV